MQEEILGKVKALAWALLAVAALAYTYQYSQFINKQYPTRTFSVEGVGDIDTTPDVAKFSVSVVTEGGRNVAEVQRLNAEKMNKINAYLKEQGIDKKDLKTAQYNVTPRYDYPNCVSGVPCPAPTISGYTLSQTLDVKVRDTEKLGDLLSGVVDKGANNVSDVRFVIDDDEEAKAEARAEAIEKANKKAKAIAKASGFRVGKLVSIYESNYLPQDGGYGMGGAAEMNMVKSSVPPTIEPGTQSTKVQVSLTYEISQ